ncbi:hypothetical protein BT69DRAFT_1282202, partial [Atractiella rhizophila]
ERGRDSMSFYTPSLGSSYPLRCKLLIFCDKHFIPDISNSIYLITQLSESS